jgi:hypothetical protein
MTALWGEDIWLGVKKHQRIEKVTGSQDDGFERGSEDIWLGVKSTKELKKGQIEPRKTGLVWSFGTALLKTLIEWLSALEAGFYGVPEVDFCFA